MERIYKYELETIDRQKLKIKGLSEVLSLCVQNQTIVLYSRIEDSETTEHNVDIYLILTGKPFNIPINAIFLDTVKIKNYGSMDPPYFVFHVFYHTEEEEEVDEE